MVVFASMTFFQHLVAAHVGQLVDKRAVALKAADSINLVVALGRKTAKVKISMPRLPLICLQSIVATTIVLS